jgi:diphthamide biosynthesis enzyme Dph1/Dph2-like protein
MGAATRVQQLVAQHNEQHNDTYSLATAILADTSYNPCCVDEIAAAHWEADAIIHYGPACLTLYVCKHAANDIIRARY